VSEKETDNLLMVKGKSLRFDTLIGTGGIGSGSFFLLKGDHTLGREESRGGRFLDRRDYCKLHILCHYVKSLLGRQFAVLPIGRVGDDEAGTVLVEEMREVELDLRYVDTLPEKRTLYSFCFLYPDGSGGNMTTEDSASGEVNAEYVATAEPEFERAGRRGIALAVPEVPLEAREMVLELGTRHGLFRVAGFTSGEIEQVCRSDLPAKVDLMAVNQDEARCLAEIGGGIADPQAIVESTITRLDRRYPNLSLSITAGAAGSWSWDGGELLHVPAIPVPVVTTGGAGDAHLAGIIAGLVACLPLAGSHRLGAILAAVSVTSPHTIYKGITRRTLADLAIRGSMTDEALLSLLR
jgi:sugar/nucleoside kinase (ribokinase family)